MGSLLLSFFQSSELMKIKFLGKPKCIDIEETRYALKFYGNILLGPRLSNNIILHVEFRDLNLGGQITPIDYDERSNNHREFLMGIHKKMTHYDTLRCMAHEMAHVRQFAKGEFTCVHTNIMRWKGMKYKLTQKTYPLVPWEKDARASEGWLLWFYAQHCLKKNIWFRKWKDEIVTPRSLIYWQK